jgi:Fe(3+) dicitrate transport protein
MRHVPISHMHTSAYFAAILLIIFSTEITAQDRDPSSTWSTADTIRKISMPQVDVIGSQDRLKRIPGSASVFYKADIERVSAISGNEVLRKVTGLHVVDEEGLGLRANIGIRGLDPDRSRTVLMLEDGVPVALAPYGEPEMYFTPAIDRMSGLEILKGSGSILYGPQTFGGVINYQTANPPATPTFNAMVRGGQGGFFTGRFSYGTTVGNTGFTASYLRKQGNNVGLVDFSTNDINAKFKMVLGSRSVVGVKLGLYDEVSNATYIGLTQPMYDSGLYDFTQLAPNDKLTIRRYSGSVNHHYFFSDNLQLKTTAFAYTTSRDWSRQDFTLSPSPNAVYNRIIGDTSIPGGAIYFIDRTGNRNRTFEVYGFEPRVSANYMVGNTHNQLDAGFRYLYERALEQRIDGTTARPTTGTLRDDEIRTGRAFSVYIQNELFVTNRISFTPGVRFEHFQYERDILRLNNTNVTISQNDGLSQVIPGAGLNLSLKQGASIFAGVHRGFGPPRVKDAISSGGESEQLDAELSWNYEIGTRLITRNALRAEFTLFYMDFTNQIIPVSESSGGLGQPGATGLVNGGETTHRGAEIMLAGNLAEWVSSTHELNFSINATISDATFSSDRFVATGARTVNVNGNTLPYAPGFMLSSTLEWATPNRLSIGATGTYVGQQYGDVLNTQLGSTDGRNGEIPSWHTIDAHIATPLKFVDGLKLNASMKNIFDARYIVSRRPQGIRAGLPRFFTVGFELSM